MRRSTELPSVAMSLNVVRPTPKNSAGLEHDASGAIQLAEERQGVLSEGGHLSGPHVGAVVLQVRVAGGKLAAHVPELLQVPHLAVLRVLLAEAGVAALARQLRHRVARLHVLGELEQSLHIRVGAADERVVDAMADDGDEAELPQPLTEDLDETSALGGCAASVVGQVEEGDAA